MKEELKEILDFIIEDKVDYCDAYVKALKILGEDVKDQWTPYDVIEAIQRAIKIKSSNE